nr:hypothetical protein [Roseobacter litoralis]
MWRARTASLNNIPRSNESEVHAPKRAHPAADCFDDLPILLMHEPFGKVDLAEVHAKRGD